MVNRHSDRKFLQLNSKSILKKQHIYYYGSNILKTKNFGGIVECSKSKTCDWAIYILLQIEKVTIH